MSSRPLQSTQLAKGMLIGTAIGIFGFMIYYGQPWDNSIPLREWIIYSIIILAWNTSPYLLLAYSVKKVTSLAALRYSLAAFALAIIGYLWILFHTAFIAPPDGQSALVFLIYNSMDMVICHTFLYDQHGY